MPQFFKNALPLAAAVALGLAALPVLADSTFSASSAGSSTSTSLASSSTSLGKSSDSASSKDRVAQGHYTLIEMAVVDGQPDMLRLRLAPVAAPAPPAPTDASAQAGAAPEPLFLVLPREAIERGQLAIGQTVAAQHRPYGLAFFALNATGNASPFFLVLDDAWHRELASRPVGA